MQSLKIFTYLKERHPSSSSSSSYILLTYTHTHIFPLNTSWLAWLHQLNGYCLNNKFALFCLRWYVYFVHSLMLTLKLTFGSLSKHLNINNWNKSLLLLLWLWLWLLSHHIKIGIITLIDVLLSKWYKLPCFIFCVFVLFLILRVLTL